MFSDVILDMLSTHYVMYWPLARMSKK